MATQRYLNADEVQVRMADEVDASLAKWHRFTNVRMYKSQSEGQVSHVCFEYKDEETGRWKYFEDFVNGIRVTPAEFK